MNTDSEGDFVCGERSDDSRSMGSLKDFIVDSDEENADENSTVAVNKGEEDDSGIEEENIFDSTTTENGKRRSTRTRKSVDRYVDSLMIYETDDPTLYDSEDELSDADDVSGDYDYEYNDEDDNSYEDDSLDSEYDD